MSENDTELEIVNIVQGINGSADKMYLSEIAKDIDFVPLELTDECIIGREPDFYFSDKYIVVYDFQQKMIFLFDKGGKFLRKIGNRGQGPGEYLYPSYFDLSGDNLFIWDSDKYVLLCYDLTTGKCLHEKHYHPDEFEPATIKCINDSLLVCYSMTPVFGVDPEGFSHLRILNFDFTVQYDLHPGNYTEPVSEEIYYNAGRFSYMKDGILHIWRENNIIYHITDDLEITPIYKLVLGKYDPKGKPDERGDYKFKIIGIQETNNFFFISGIYNFEYAKCIVYNKTTKKSKYVAFRSGDSGFHNDIDGGIAFWPHGSVSRNVLYAPASVRGLKNLINHSSVKSAEMKNKEKHQKLKDYLASANEDANPIIFFVTMK